MREARLDTALKPGSRAHLYEFDFHSSQESQIRIGGCNPHKQANKYSPFRVYIIPNKRQHITSIVFAIKLRILIFFFILSSFLRLFTKYPSRILIMLLFPCKNIGRILASGAFPKTRPSRFSTDFIVIV